MSIAKQVLFLRMELGLSFRQIARIVYNRSDSKAVLKVYGIYRTYMRRYNASKDGVIAKQGVITGGDWIADTVAYYPISRVLEDHTVGFIGDLAGERMHLARMLKYVEGEKRKEIYRKLNRVKLLELVVLVYDLIGLAQYDNTRMYLSMLYSTAKKLVDRVDLDHDGVKISSNGIRYLNDEAAAFLYVVFFTVLHRTRFSWMLDRLNEIIYSLSSRRSWRRKMEGIRNIIVKKYGDILASTILHP